MVKDENIIKKFKSTQLRHIIKYQISRFQAVKQIVHQSSEILLYLCKD